MIPFLKCKWPVLVTLPLILLSACVTDEKDVREEFFNLIKGNWTVTSIFRMTKPVLSPDLVLLSQQESIIYIDHSDTTIFLTDDPNLCDVPEMSRMSNWYVKEKKNKLFLSVDNVCGERADFKMNYENIELDYEWDWTGLVLYEDVQADVSLQCPDDDVQLIFFKSDGYRMTFRIVESNWVFDFTLNRI